MSATPPPFSTLIAARELLDLLARGATPVILDASFDLTDPGVGERAYADGHIPGSHYVHLDRDLSGPKTGSNGRHPLPARDALALTAARLGIAPGRQVVAYDRQDGAYAARAWWLLRWLGHREVALLDGGLAAWQRAGGAVTAQLPPAPAPTEPYPEGLALMPTIDVEHLHARLGRVTLIDARGGERFRGEVEPLDKAAGHIPGALNRFFKHNLDADGCFKSREALRAEFAPLIAGPHAQEVVHSCGSGVTACHNLLAMEHAGLPSGSLYGGSWSEWSSDPARPIAKG